MPRLTNSCGFFFEIKKYLLLCCGIVHLFNVFANARDNYNAPVGTKLDTMQQREMAAREQIALEQIKIENLKQDLQACTRKHTEALNERYRLLNTDGHRYSLVISDLNSITSYFEKILSADISSVSDKVFVIDSLYNYIVRLNETTRFNQLSDVAKKMQVIKDLHARISASISLFQQQVLSAKSMDTVIPSDIERTEINQSMEPGNSSALADTWIVSSDTGARESLFRIAGYPQVYGDPYKWRKLYLANKDMIDKNFEKFQKSNKAEVSINPQDVLFPGQILRIPR